MLNNVLRQPGKFWALSFSLLGLGACSSTGPGADASATDYSYTEVPADYTETGSEGFDSSSFQHDVSNVAASATTEASPVRVRQGGAAYRASRFPEIASRAFQKDGYWLNGYVFVRGERSWEDLSRLLYGRADRAALLAQWNAGAEVKPGSVVYYNSPFRADDTSELKSFDSDFGMTLSGVSVAAGDSLSGLAAKLYGNPDAWRELASLNQDLLSSPDRLEVGQSLRVAPAQRDTAPVLQAYVQKVQNEAQVALEQNTASQEQVADASAALTEQQSLEAQGAQAPPAPVAEAETAVETTEEPALPLAQLAIGLVALLAVAGGVAYAIRRRKSLAEANASNTVFFGKKTGTED